MMTEQIQTDDQTPVREINKLSKRWFVFLNTFIFSVQAFHVGAAMIAHTYFTYQTEIDGFSVPDEYHIPFLAWIAVLSIPLIGAAWGYLNYQATLHSLLLGSVAFSGSFCVSIIASFALAGVVFGTVPTYNVLFFGFACFAMGITFYIVLPKIIES